mmetsp:Transcript_71781/g.166028  ORF Transcript_71781/g.166028 Transcript_71781/m.166028 type:complete len:104 (+) Transcript_71781:65-376(+)|eukprot:CAMPEP_0171098904 /NCGR_PEP_ID=MMETSP0766_2-20121228/49810_1 /TAXON_ID=439317 /ORGANISM="Gambierdiscus australes, Strain CAWD 149" /LENGTH=103 /DNA_ID=CAMNT_0011558375 /DNA_START=52 /DNA_END=363 /DNA_ORIENTATION=+
MVHPRSSLLARVVSACAAAACISAAPGFLSPAPRGLPEVRMPTAAFFGLMPLTLEQPAGAYDSVVAMLQSWLVGGTVLVLIFAAVLVAATANPLTKRRREVTK